MQGKSPGALSTRNQLCGHLSKKFDRPPESGPLLNPGLNLNQHHVFTVYFRVLILNQCYNSSSVVNPMYCIMTRFSYFEKVLIIINVCCHATNIL